jgi:hypothetical protein
VSTLDAKVVQPTGDFHGQIVIHFLRMTQHILHTATPFDAMNAMCNHHTEACHKRLVLCLLWRQCFPWGVFLGLKSDDPFGVIPLQPCIFLEGEMWWKSGLFCLDALFGMTCACISWAPVMDVARLDATNNARLARVGFFVPL